MAVGRNISIMGEHAKSLMGESASGNSSDGSVVVSAAELRRRVRAQERQRAAAKLAAAEAVRRARERTERLRAELADARRAESEAMAAALRIFGTAGDVAEVTGLPADAIERGAKGVPAARAAVVVDELATRVPRPRGGGRSRRPSGPAG